ncbi:SDR family oxidoreductase [uncultured Sphingomonas sp.]|uniref:SDR family oxidoreductase n=1 Tax=uncultured Sphingomonas sp. TaxID=158754 RepID=UPI00260B457D|nr:SDR family oxidoreductase [uncultured Sphingomonas sp.]
MTRRKVLVTGAAGGMGRACARLFGATHDLVLTDASARLTLVAEELEADAYTVRAARTGDLGDTALLDALVADLGSGEPVTILHTAGLSPSQADWRSILSVNLVATEKLLAAVEPILAPGSVVVAIASTAGHVPIEIPGTADLLKAPLDTAFLDTIGAIIEAAAGGNAAGASGLAYLLSKRAVLRLVERKAVAWGAKGARIVSISPGLILTPMGRQEVEQTPGAAETRDAAPAGRPGTAMDIALAARFLASDSATFITGTDLRVDGGTTAAMLSMAG